MKSFIDVFLCFISSSHSHCLLVLASGWLLRVHRLISLIQKCHCSAKAVAENSCTTPITQYGDVAFGESKPHLITFMIEPETLLAKTKLESFLIS